MDKTSPSAERHAAAVRQPSRLTPHFEVATTDRIFWALLAPGYDEFLRWFCPEYRTLADRVVADVGTATRVLDVGAGTGTLALQLAPHVAAVEAVDLSSAMLAVARRKQATSAVPTLNLRFSVQSAYALSFRNGSFDAVVTCNTLHILGDPLAALREMRRVLKPDGILISATYCHGADVLTTLRSVAMSLWGFHARTLFTPSQVRELVARAGFDVTAADTLPGWFPLAYVVGRLPESLGHTTRGCR